ncbi:uncharacterized protein C13orf46 homolog [Megaptera novaeangliae]
MEKDTTAAHRRHRLGPGAPPSAVSPGHLKAASEMAELQRSRSVGGLHQKGDPPSCIKTLCKELESEDQGKDLRSDAEDARCQANPEEDELEQRQDAAGQVPGGWKEAEPEASGQEEPDGRESTDKCALEAKVRPWSFDVHVLPALPVGVLPLFICLVSSYRKGSQSPYSWVTFCKKSSGSGAGGLQRQSLGAAQKPPVFVEIDLGDRAEEVITCAMKEEKRSQMDMGDFSEDETGTSWVCCIPYSTRKKVGESS